MPRSPIGFPAGAPPGYHLGDEDVAQGAKAWDPKLPESNDRPALAALAAAGGENLATSTGRFPGTETYLSGSFLAVRAEGGLHGFAEFKSRLKCRTEGGVSRVRLSRQWVSLI